MAGQASIEIVDAQVHLWAPNTPSSPWPQGQGQYAHGDSFSPSELLKLMDETGIDRAVLVPPAFSGDRNDFCARAAVNHPTRFAVMGRIDLTKPITAEELLTWQQQPGVLGARVTFSRGESVRWLDDGTAAWFWPAAEAAGVPVMVYPPGLLHLLEPIAASHPGLPIVIDHLALGHTDRDDAIDDVLFELLRFASYPNVAVKASALPNAVSEPYPFRSLHRRLKLVIREFSPQRVFWGSDLTRLQCPYREVKSLFMEELDFVDDDDLRWIMGRGVRTWLGWTEN